MPGAADIPGRDDAPESSRPLDQSGRLQQRLDNLPDGHPSSPRDEDGSWRAPAVSLKDLELPIEDTPNDTDAPPGTADQPSPSDATSDAWRKEVPGFRAAWESHLERWPEESHASDDQSGYESGSWPSDVADCLTKEQITDTDNVLKQVREVEVKVTALMKAVETTIPGATLIGLDNRLKGEDRFKEKVAYEVAREPDQPVADIIERIPDKIRYTFQFSPERYADGYWDVCMQLADRGNELLLCRNAWEEKDYKGINTRWIGAERQTFEIQFHTPDSFAAKQLTHPAYERIRTINEPGAESQQLEEFQRHVTSKIRLPDSAEAIPNYRKEGY